MNRVLRVAGALVAASLLAGCPGDPGRDALPAKPDPTVSADPEGARSPQPSATTQPPTPPPGGGCYRLGFAELAEPTSVDDPVPCAWRHTTQTIHVGELDTVVEGHSVSVNSEHVRAQLDRVCPRRMAGFLGGTREERRLSRFEAVWFSPSLELADHGADWFRCDVVALAGREHLLRLPPPRRLQGALDREGALASYGLCGTAAPGSPDFTRVICDRPHRWRAISTIPLAGGQEYPGQAEVRRAGDADCRDEARARAEDPLQFRYGWEWPGRDQWEAGQHYGYCWVPD